MDNQTTQGNIPFSIVHLNKKQRSFDEEGINGFDNSYKVIDKIKNEVEIVNNPYQQETTIDDIDDFAKSATQEIIIFVKNEVCVEEENYNSCNVDSICKNKSKDNIPIHSHSNKEGNYENTCKKYVFQDYEMDYETERKLEQKHIVNISTEGNDANFYSETVPIPHVLAFNNAQLPEKSDSPAITIFETYSDASSVSSLSSATSAASEKISRITNQIGTYRASNTTHTSNSDTSIRLQENIGQFARISTSKNHLLKIKSKETFTKKKINKLKKLKKYFRKVKNEVLQIKRENALQQRHIEEIKIQNIQILTHLQELRSELQSTIFKKEHSNSLNMSSFVAPAFPLRTIEDFIKFDTNLRDGNFKAHMINLFNNIRGLISDNVRKSVKRSIERIVTYDILINFSWTGKNSFECSEKTKLEFMSLKGIIDFLRDLFPKDELESVDFEIKYFMRRVPQKYKRNVIIIE